MEAESDSLEVINFCVGQERWWDPAAAIFASCIDEAAMTGKVDFLHCLREANGVAHELADFCFKSIIDCNWLDDPPDFLVDKLLNDVSLVD